MASRARARARGGGERDDDEHIASGGDPREPTGLRVGQRPGLDELRQQRRNNRESGQAEDFGGAYGGNNRHRKRCRGGLSQSHGFHEKTPVGGTGVLGVDDRAGGIAIDRLVSSKHRREPAVHISVSDIHNLMDYVVAWGSRP
jgi:hypothetical protein